MIAIVILMVGILSIVAAISAAVVQARGQEQQLTARHLAASAMASIMSVKETDPARLGWKAIGNVGTNPDINTGVFQGIFVAGMQPVRMNAGPDEVIGTADDTGAVVNGFRRQIAITDECDPDRPSYNCPTPGTEPVKIRMVVITVEYYVGRGLNTIQIVQPVTDTVQYDL